MKEKSFAIKKNGEKIGEQYMGIFYDKMEKYNR